ncbi:MAG TPA: hypothetical protein DCP84_19815 [Pseudomonas sp.]|nr:hypothetical protein [Pseudomonas sp.]
MFNRLCRWTLILPQCCRFLGVNSVTNSDLHKGFMPVPIVRNEHWLKFSHVQSWPHVRRIPANPAKNLKPAPKVASNAQVLNQRA